MVRHHRREPVDHAFAYATGWLLLDLDRARPLLDRGWWSRWLAPAFARFHRRDFLAGGSDLAATVRERVAASTGQFPAGPVHLLTTLRTAGSSFNPVSFYFCHAAADGPVTAVVAEITNTPWGERHAYVLGESGGDAANLGTPQRHLYRFGKRFHVSPFMPMGQSYEWRFAFHPRRLAISMHNHDARGRVFTADLVLALRPATPARWFRHLLSWPLNAVRALAAIYWQAGRLWLRRVPFHDHPSATPSAA
jgi:hypothetical protein